MTAAKSVKQSDDFLSQAHDNLFILFVVPIATILGSPEIYLDVGSTINLTCIIKHTPMPPADVQWKHNEKVS